jgi:mttA/Hcf106 family protein
MEHINFIFHWVIVLAVILILFGGRKIADVFRNFRGGGRGGGPHPLPATGAVERSRGSANPKESRPVCSDRAQ